MSDDSKETKALTTTAGGDDLVEGGLEGFDASDMEVPRLALVQPTSASLLDQGARPGQLWDSGLGCGYESVRVVPISIKKGRVMFEGGEVACKSDDAKLPSRWIENPVSPACDGCESGQWIDRRPPACQVTYQLCLYRPDDGMPCMMTVKGMGIKPTKRLITAIGMRRVAPWRIEATLGVAKQSNAKGTFYVPQWGDIKVVDPADKYERIARGLNTDHGAKPESEMKRAAEVDMDDIPF